MRNKRLILIISIMLMFIFVFSFSSTIFELKKVDVIFLGKNNDEISLSSNEIFNSSEKINNIISTTNFEYGKLIFLQNKDKYLYSLERNNAYIKALQIESIFPDKLKIKLRERFEQCYFSYNTNKYILDEEYKILVIRQDETDLVEIKFIKEDNEVSYFDFFDLSPKALSVGLFLYEYNLVFQSIKNLFYILSNYSFILARDIRNIDIILNREQVDLKIVTKNDFGIKLYLENILDNFDKKYNKILLALKTLFDYEKIKTSYGNLKINNNCNCFWINL